MVILAELRIKGPTSLVRSFRHLGPFVMYVEHGVRHVLNCEIDRIMDWGEKRYSLWKRRKHVLLLMSRANACTER